MKHFKSLFVVLALATLGGCVNGHSIFEATTNPFSKDKLAQVEASYGVAASLSLGFRNACAAGNLPASSNCRTVVKVIQNADNYTHAQILVARSFVKNNPTIDATTVVSAAQGAIAAYQKAQTENGVN